MTEQARKRYPAQARKLTNSYSKATFNPDSGLNQST